MYGSDMYFLSALNPADNPTQEREVLSPPTPLPTWLTSPAAGSFSEFGTWLEESGASVYLGDLDPSELIFLLMSLI